MTAIAPTDTIAYHRERSWHFLDLVDDEIERGELEEACNKVWGAAAHALRRLPKGAAGPITPTPCWRTP